MNAFDKWECPECHNELGWLCFYCVYCDVHNIHITNPDIENRLMEKDMTPQENLFKELYNHEKVLVKDMDGLTLRAHREQLAKIAFEARARLSAVDDLERERKPKKEDKGFQRSINGDSVASDAINTVKERQARLTKKEKLVEGLMKLGYTREDAEKKMSAGALLGHLQSKAKAEAAALVEKKEEHKPIFNPFEKK